MATYVARLNTDWRVKRAGDVWKESPEFTTKEEAHAWLKNGLELLYPGQWERVNSEQYSAPGSFGGYCMGYVHAVYTEEEQLENEIGSLIQQLHKAQSRLTGLRKAKQSDSVLIDRAVERHRGPTE